MIKKLKHYVKKYLDSSIEMMFISLVSDNRYHLRLLKILCCVEKNKSPSHFLKSKYKRLSDQNRAHRAEIAEVTKNLEVKKYLAKRQTSHSRFAVDSLLSARFTAFSAIARMTIPSQFETR